MPDLPALPCWGRFSAPCFICRGLQKSMVVAKRCERWLLCAPAFLLPPSQLHCFLFFVGFFLPFFFLFWFFLFYFFISFPDLVRNTKSSRSKERTGRKENGERGWNRQWRQWCNWWKENEEGSMWEQYREKDQELRNKLAEKSERKDKEGNLPLSLLNSFVMVAHLSEDTQQHRELSSNHQIWCSRIFP